MVLRLHSAANEFASYTFFIRLFLSENVLEIQLEILTLTLYSYRSVDPYFLTGSWIPRFCPVHGSLISYRSVELYFLTGSWFPRFCPVHGSLFSYRSVDLYFLTGSWIPRFWPVHASLYLCFQIRLDWNQTKIWFSSGPDNFQIWIWIQSGQIWRKKIFFVQTKSRFRSGPEKNLDGFVQIIWTRF